MANKFLDDVGLNHLWDKIASTFAKKSDVTECQKTLIVTCTADFMNGTLTDVSHTLAQIQSAYAEGKHIILNADISQLSSNAKASLPLIMVEETGVHFSAVIFMGDGATAITTGIRPSAGNYLMVMPLVQQSQIGGLTFATSSTAPTVDDSNVITFVDEG